VLALVAALLGAPPGVVRQILSGGGSGEVTETTRPRATSPEEEKLVEFVRVVLGSTEDTWSDVLPRAGRSYVPPRLVLFSDAVRSACGIAGAAVGPFYCPRDRQVYLDLSFFRELDRRFGAPGDFAQAYVVAHEVGHHVQKLIGVLDRMHAQRARLTPEAANRLTVRSELQADCLAGVWAHYANKRQKMLEPGDVEEGMRAAAAIGDDTLQKAARGRVAPESFTHGTSEQRVRWLRKGMDTGSVESCDTFRAADL
jgi:predicted metalloprotease